MADIIRGGEASLQLPGRGSVWGDANTPDPTGELINNIKERKKEFKDFYNTQKEEVDALNESLKGMQGRDYTDMLNQTIATRNEIAKLYSTATPKNYNSPDFQSKFAQIKDKFVQMKNSIDTRASSLAKATQFIKENPHVARGEGMKYVTNQTSLSQSDPNADKDPYFTVSQDPKFYNGSAAVDDAIAKLGKEGVHTFNKQDGYLNRTYKKKYNTALYEKLDNGTIKFNPAPELLDVLLQDPRMVNQVMNFMTPESANKLTELSESEKEKAMRFHLGEFIKEKHNLEQRFEPSVEEVRIDERTQPSGASKVEQDMNAAAKALLENLKNGNIKEAFSNLTVGEGEDGYYKFEPIYNTPGDPSSGVVSIKAYKRIEKGKLTEAEKIEGLSDPSVKYDFSTENISAYDFGTAKDLVAKTLAYTKAKKPTTIAATGSPSATPKKQIKQSEVAAKAKASGYTEAEYRKLLAEKGVEIIK